MTDFPFSAIVGQERMKLALALNAIDPGIGGVLIQGERGTAKSTAVRALAAILPDIPVAADCALGCDPREPAPFCPQCQGRAGEPEIARRRAPFIDLPLGAGEDRVLGHLDLEAALGQGVQRFRPGLLFAAHRGVLYVDEVNLLPDHLVDVLLDAAASGWHVVEREGFSVRHASRFVLVGTMNPEEGDLRPQLLDRFGLGVEVAAPTDRAERLLVVERRMAFERDPQAFGRAHEAEQAGERQRIARGQALLAAVEVPREALEHLVEICAESGVEGMRGDLVTYRAARAVAAYAGRTAVTRQDVEAAAELALFHRRGDRPEPHPPADGPPRGPDERRPDGQGSPPPDSGQAPNGAPQGSVQAEGGRPLPDRVAPPAEGRLAPIRWRERRQLLRAVALQGRHRRRSEGEGLRGRRVRAREREAGACAGVAWPESIARAILRRGMAAGGQGRLDIRAEDLLRPVREGRARLLTVLLVDASGSMGAYRRMAVTKAAVLALVRRAYQLRDRVAVVTFRGQGAQVLLAPTDSLRLTRARLAHLPTGGRTPLSAGLACAGRLLRQTASRMPGYRARLLVLSDGHANAAPRGQSPLRAALEEADRLRRAGVQATVVDTSEGWLDLGLAGQIAQALGAPCLPVAALIEIARKEVSA